MAKSSRAAQVLATKSDVADETQNGDRSVAAQESAAEADLPAVSGSSRIDRIRLAAYAAAERRGFAAGHEEEDWLEAERQIDQSAASRTAYWPGLLAAPILLPLRL